MITDRNGDKPSQLVRQPSQTDPREQEAAGLRARFPGWFIWFVPLSTGPLTWWSARREPLLEAGTAQGLAKAMAEVEGADISSLVLSAAEVPASGPGRLPILDRLRAELAVVLPGWHIVFRPLMEGPVEWEAYRLPVLRADSAGELAKEISRYLSEAGQESNAGRT